MTTEAVIAIQIPISTLSAELGTMAASELAEAVVPGCEVLRGRNGAPLFARGLEDATLVFTQASLRDVEPDELSHFVRLLLGDVLDRHADARGLLVFPDAVRPKARRWLALVEELGELGEWLPIVDASYVPERLKTAQPGSLESVAAQLMSALGPDLGTLQQSLLSGDATALEDAQRKIQELLTRPEGAGLMQALGQIDFDATLEQAQQLFGDQEPETESEALDLESPEDDEPKPR
jgi:hypothetical protein